MNRSDLQLLAQSRLEDAKVLIESQRWSAAYYLLGYVVECALKACAAHQFRSDEIPDKTVVNDFYTHRLDKLLAISGIKTELEERLRSDSAFAANWATVRNWSEASRYDHSISPTRTNAMLAAVDEAEKGVFSWLRTVWSKNN